MNTATYKNAGVNIDAGNALVERIKPLAKATTRAGVVGGLGGFGALFDLKAAGYTDPLLVSGTDGVGTKLKIAQLIGNHTTIGIDLVAMCVNDLIVQGAEPLFFLDYFACGTLSVDDASAIIAGIARGCEEAGCALIGGETAEMPGMYAPGEYDLAGFAVGAVERARLLPQNVAEGDILLGLASSGFHSNGYSLVRHVVESHNLDYATPAAFAPDISLGEALLAPTKLYIKSCLEAIQYQKGGEYPVKALAHITGGGLLENIPRVLPGNLSAHLHLHAWETPPVFSWLQELGHIENTEMWRTFNCGIGMVVVVSAQTAEEVKALLQQAGEMVFTIGSLKLRAQEAVIIHG